MKKPPEPAGKEQRLLRHARREGLLIMAVWTAALVWSIGIGYFFGYVPSVEEADVLFGMPRWVFWSVVVPWGLCLAFSVWFCFFYMADDDLGQDRFEGPDHE
jgi:hypothetical protein